MLIEIKEGVRANPKARGTVPKICVLKCDICNAIFERDYSYRKLTVHRCSKKCVYGSRSTDGLGNRGGEVVEVDCLVCGKHMKHRKIGNERKWGKTCSRNCYGIYRSQHPELYESNTSSMHTPEVHQKISHSLQEKMKQPGWVSSFKGKKHKVESIERIKKARIENPLVGSKNGMFGRKHTKKSRETMSDKHTRLLVDGKVRPYGGNTKKGVYHSHKTGDICNYKSGWEFAIMQFLDANPNVTTWKYEPIRISYIYNDNKRWYVPDFLVTFQDDRSEIWEIKPKEFIDSEKNILKSEAAQRYCQLNNIDAYQVITGDILRQKEII